MVSVVRWSLAALVCAAVVGAPASAQAQTGVVNGRVIDSVSNQPIANVTVAVVGTRLGALTREDGRYSIGGVPAGAQRIRVNRIGYALQEREIQVLAGGTVSADFTISTVAARLSEVVVTGYGTQRREAITGAVATVAAEEANVGVVVNPNQLVVGRVAGVQTTLNAGEPGGGTQIRIRGGTSISASNEPLYVIDGVPLQNEETTPGGIGIGGISAGLARSPLNSINPNDIESITVLKDASATAIYGSRGANGVILIQTKRGAAGAGQVEYEVYVGASEAARRIDFASGAQYRSYIQEQVNLYIQDSVANAPTRRGLAPSSLAALGRADTDWEDELTRRGSAVNHNFSFSGGSQTTQYRASFNYFDQQGVVISSGLERYQGRLNANHDAMGGRLRLGVNLMAARVVNDYAPTENTGGFIGGLFTNMAIYNPTFPVRTDSGTFFELGTGAQDVRNPVAMAMTYDDVAPENRVLGNVSGTFALLQDLTAQTTLGVDYTDAVRRTFAPRTSPIGAQYGGFASQAQRNLQTLNLQQLLTYSPRFGVHDVEVVGGYEYSTFERRGFGAQMQGFITDAFGVNNLSAGTQASSPVPYSFRVQSTLVSFFSRANYGFADRYFLTGVVRYDGSSRLAPGHQWSLFPALSASWRLSREDFMQGRPFGISTLALRAGWGRQGNQAVEPYQTQLLLRADPGATYPFGGQLTTGLRAAQVGNPDLQWESAEQVNLGVDYGFLDDRFTGSFEVYQKNTRDLLLEVSVPQPAVVSTRIENIGSLRNRGLEASMDMRLFEAPGRSLAGGLVFTMERNEVTSLGDTTQSCREDRDACRFINTGWVSGQGQSGQYSQRIMLGEPIGTFFASRFLRVNEQGQQVFACNAGSAGCTNGETTSPADADREIVGNANPDFTLGLRNNATWGRMDASWLWRGEFGGKVFNNTALVYQTKSNAKQGRNFLAAALGDPDDISEPAKFSTRWIEDRTFVRLQNVTLGYTFDMPTRLNFGRGTRVYVSGDNLLLLTGYSGYDPEVFVASGLANRGMDYLTYPRPRTYMLGARVLF